MPPQLPYQRVPALPDWRMVYAAGFRLFFLLAGLQAVAAMAGWLTYYFGTGWLPHALPPVLWHGHEMVFGFAGAALAGFLLTALPNWTKTPLPGGPPVLLLGGVWLAGRLTLLFGALLPGWLTAAASLAFIPGLAWLLRRPLRSHPAFLALLAGFWLGDALVCWELLSERQIGLTGLRLGIYVLAVAIAVVAGRLVPMFMASWLEAPAPAAPRWLEQSAVPLLGLALLADLLIPDRPLTAMLLFAAAGLHAARLAAWQGHRALGHPILWVLHAGYAWLAIGLALRGLSALTPLVPPTAALHAFTTGAIGITVLGVMTRAGLAHTGRPVMAPPAIAWAYGLVLLSAVLRAFGPVAAPSLAGGLVPAASGALWLLGYGVFLTVFLPMLTRPRADGKPG